MADVESSRLLTAMDIVAPLGEVCSSSSRVEINPLSAMDATKKVTPPANGYSLPAAKDDETTRVAAPRDPRKKYEKLLNALPFSEAESKILIAGARLGLLHETLAMLTIQSHLCPESILLPLSDDEKNRDRMGKFYRHADRGDKEQSAAFADLAAYMFWDYSSELSRRKETGMIFLKLCRLEKRKGKAMRLNELSYSNLDFNKSDCRTKEALRHHSDFCQKHTINLSSVLSVSRTIEDVLKILFRSEFEPEWLKCQEATPIWRKKVMWKGSGMTSLENRKDVIWKVYGNSHAPLLCRVLHNLFETGGDIATSIMPALELATKGSWIPCEVKVRMQTQTAKPLLFIVRNTNRLFGTNFSAPTPPRVVRPSHDLFVAGKQKKKGIFAFPDDIETADRMIHNKEPVEFLPVAPCLSGVSIDGGAGGWFRRQVECLLLLDDFNLSKSLCFQGHPPRATSTLNVSGLILARQHIGGVDVHRIHRNCRIQNMALQGHIYCFAWTFPFGGTKFNDKECKSRIMEVFCSLALLFERMIDEVDWDVSMPTIMLRPFVLGLALHDDQFSRWSVLRSAERAGWRLRAWSSFEVKSFPCYYPSDKSGRPLSLREPRFYVFRYEPQPRVEIMWESFFHQ